MKLGSKPKWIVMGIFTAVIILAIIGYYID